MSQPKKNAKRDLPYWAPIHTKAHEAVGDYFKSKLDAELPRQRPVWDKPRTSPAAELVAARRDLEVCAKELASKREYQAEMRTEMDAKWEDLREKERDLRSAFIKYNKFIKENHEKRERAEQKVREEEATQKRRDAEIENLKKRVEELEQIKETMERHVGEYRIYQDFLQRVVAECKEFTSVHDILDRYDTLAATRAQLAARQDADLHALEEARRALMQLTEEKSKALMGLNNQLAELWVRYDQTRMQDFQWETSLSHIKVKAAQKTWETGAVRMMCWNLYQQLCYCRGEAPALAADKIEEQLLYIERAFLQLRAINKLARRNMARENASMPSNSLPEDLVAGRGGPAPSAEPRTLPKIVISGE
ncbi:Coiled-coil domain-containing protein 42-like protein [Frankliniella fusca]|uniref:Coiled-coil domain-containing protein 42-like protein n=1 Tax=Frankliniella fusca TaxID=407009 RepID=A0AAE1LUR1_9NEOP|nr:Coiled-coil domain-containing protein 42-like protein [Frankliniella fusca]